MQHLLLSAGWELKERNPDRVLEDDFVGSDGWLPAQSPGTVHQDLLAAGRIPDPFVGLNEHDVQWVGERDWLYRCTFDVPADLIEAQEVVLCCDGLDTFATVWLNGEHVLESDNMFVPQRVPVKSLLRAGRNELRILFESAMRRGKEREAEHGELRVWNGDASRVYVRKAQYHYGWDWGPTLMTAGPWLPVRLEAYDARISEINCPVDVADDLKTAQVPVHITVDDKSPDADASLTVQVQLRDPSDAIVDETRLPVSNRQVEHNITIDQPHLWWPRGYGEQHRYRLVITLDRDGTELDRCEQQIGLRRLRLVQEPMDGEEGRSFLFEINNTPIFCGGANWIPADSFLPRIAADRYREHLQLAADANMVMLRIWGGGIYEADVFYDVCDELGLLIWQDFMFGCGIYPATPWFQESVRAEAEAQLCRLRHHPSIVLWCGNNEDYQIARSNNLYDASFDGDFATTGFPARAIYERLLPEVCSALDPTRTYWPGSPYAGDDPDDPMQGDRHAWEVWKGADYHNYPTYGGRFVSEFGMSAAPHVATIESFAPQEERYPFSRTFEHHNKAADGPRRLAAYLSDNVRLPSTLADYVYSTQFVQAEALGLAYRSWRRQWREPGQYASAGALVWQINDCWPVTSWAIVDYALRPKPAYYVIGRELAPAAVGLARSDHGVDVWAVNGLTTSVEAELDIVEWTLDGERLSGERRRITLDANQSTELGAIQQSGEAVVAARLFVNGDVAARAVLWPEPYKYLHLPDPAIKVSRIGEDRVRVRTARPAKGVWLDAGDGVRWSDNMLDLLPDDDQIVTAAGLGDRQIDLQWLR